MQTLPIVRRKVRESSLSRVAASLGISRHTLANYLLGIARAGTQALVDARAQELGWLDADPESDRLVGHARGSK